MDALIHAKAVEYTPLAAEILAEAVRIPEDHIAQDPVCGMSNHEGPRLEYLTRRIIEIGAVEKAEDVWYDDFGNLIWKVEDLSDGVAPEDRRIVWFDGHTDTVAHLPEAWEQKIGGGISVFKGLTDPDKVDTDFLRAQLGYLPPREEWEHLLFGRGTADQLAGVIDQIIATKIMLELKSEGALRGVTIYSIGTVAEEDNDGGGPMFCIRKDLPTAETRLQVPEVVIFTEGTCNSDRGAMGIYRGQRGRMQIEVEVVGQSAHGSMPHMGKNPLEAAAAILKEAAEKHIAGVDILDDEFLGKGTRTASWCTIDTPSDCAVPDRFVFRFDRRMTVGESPDFCVAAIERLDSVASAREAGFQVTISIPRYTEPSWRGVCADNDQIYMGWKTPAEHPAIVCAEDVYRSIVTPNILPEMLKDSTQKSYHIPAEPRTERWIFSTDGVGFPLPADDVPFPIEGKHWVEAGGFTHPAMFGFGAGHEHNTHKIGEFVDTREMTHAIAFMARFPSKYAEM